MAPPTGVGVGAEKLSPPTVDNFWTVDEALGLVLWDWATTVAWSVGRDRANAGRRAPYPQKNQVIHRRGPSYPQERRAKALTRQRVAPYIGVLAVGGPR